MEFRTRVCENCGTKRCDEVGCDCAPGILSKMCVVCLREVGIPVPGEKTSAQLRRERMRKAVEDAKPNQSWLWGKEL